MIHPMQPLYRQPAPAWDWLRILTYTLVASYAVIVFCNTATAWMTFPLPYANSEWLINWSIGYVRRGLFGTILYMLPPDGVRAAVVLLPLVAATGMMALAWKALGKAVDPGTRLLLMFSPFAGGLFLSSGSEMFRKDGLYMLLLFSIYIPALACAAGRISSRLALAIGMAAFVLATFVHEQAAILAVLPLCFLVSVCNGGKPLLRSWLFYAVVAVGTALLALNAAFPGTYVDGALITTDWTAKFQNTPYAFIVPLVELYTDQKTNSAISFIGHPFDSWLGLSASKITQPRIFIQVLACAVCAFAPIIFLWTLNHVRKQAESLHGRSTAALVLSVFALSCVSLVCVHIDYARVMMLLSSSLVAYTVALLLLNGRRAESAGLFSPRNCRDFFLAFAFFFGFQMHVGMYYRDTMFYISGAWIFIGLLTCGLAMLTASMRRWIRR